MTRVAILTSLITYAIVASQPLFYLVVLTNAQRALSASAYIELRQRINAVMTERLPIIYLSTLLAVLVLLVVSWRISNWYLVLSTTIALLCLLVDVRFMLGENVPINGVIDQWTPTSYPADWESYRAKWFAIFRYRQVVLLVGFFSLLIGAVSPW